MDLLKLKGLLNFKEELILYHIIKIIMVFILLLTYIILNRFINYF